VSLVLENDVIVRLLGNETLAGKRFLDIGCGSGLHSLAALQLGAAEVVVAKVLRLRGFFFPDRYNQ